MPATKTVSILEGNMFVVSDLRGDIDASPTETKGLFAFDTRYLSQWILKVNGQSPNVLSTDDLQYYSAQFFLVPGTGTVYVDADLSITRIRAVGNGFHEDLTVLNHKADPVDLDITIEAAADFADLFEVKDALAKKGELYSKVEGGQLILGYRRDHFVRETWITATAPEVNLTKDGLSFHVHIAGHSEWTTGIDVRIGRAIGTKVFSIANYRSGQDRAALDMGKNLDEWLAAAPRLTCDWDPAERIYKKSLVDLAALRFTPGIVPGGSLPAAGLPWFMSIFGRDSILTSFQSLPVTQELAETTIKALAAWQGTRVDDFRDEEPGKIMHELRYGELTAFQERPHSPYYGSADATALFLILLDEYERWSGNDALVRELQPEARAALNWIDAYGDRNGDGYVEYSRRNTETGLENQCWKDSWNSILFADGTNSKLPRATCEIQGYVYDAKMRSARLAREFWNDEKFATDLERQAAELKRRFNQDYWIPDREFFALAIDGDGRKVDALTSNIGHLLWSGIAEEDKAAACVRHLMSDELFSGWGVRTMATTEGGYNPIGYHVGTVWPHDNAFISWGLVRYGYRAEAARIAQGILDAAPYFRDRLPEAFAGYPRQRTQFPVEYPTACSPQAWATGAPLLMMRTLLGLEPTGPRLFVDPAIPDSIGRLELLDIPGRWGRIDAFGRGRVDVTQRTDPAAAREMALHLASA
ncbi:MAG: Glycogen debranching enzyme [Ktedonobacterales bacterium]|jgi:glycogen debranching enzyme|nr:MAG: Glycogen debranching enzyme [Ktedonobacterales bacterium]